MLEDLLSKAKKEVRQNTNFIDPDFFMFRGRSKVAPQEKSEIAAETISKPEVVSPVIPVNVSKTCSSTTPSSTATTSLNSPLPLIPDTTPYSLSSRISIQVYRTRKDTAVDFDSVDTQFGDPSSSSRASIPTQDTTSQTTCLDLPLLVLPPLPESRNELEAYLRWLCNAMEQIGRVRESAKQIKETSKLHQEREVRRKLEAEVR